MKIKKLKNDMILVSPYQEKEYHGIIIPDKGMDKPQLGMIVALSEGLDEDLKKGTNIIFGKYAGLDIELDNKKLILLHKQDVIAIYED